MESDIQKFVISRIEDKIRNLREVNGEYALAHNKAKEWIDCIDRIILNDKEELTLSRGDCLNFKEFIDSQFTEEAICQEELYRQGYLDCIVLLKQLGMLA